MSSFVARAWTAVRNNLRGLVDTVRGDRALLASLTILLAIDLGWTAWFGIAKYLSNSGINEAWYELRHLRITIDGSWPELFNYAKTLVLVLLLARLAEALRQPIYAALVCVFAVILADDALQLHEKWGEYLADTFEIQSMMGVRGQDIGEVVIWAGFGLILVPLLAIGLARSDWEHREYGVALLVPFGLLLFCAVVVDQFYHVFKGLSIGSTFLIFVDMIEDGGEMIAITLACILTAAVMRRESIPLFAGPTERETDPGDEVTATSPSPRRLLEYTAGVALLGAFTMLFLDAFAIGQRTYYHADLSQSPHWIAYHGDAFPKDDLFVEYGAFNESPLQNAIYWVGTWFIDVVPFHKLVGVGLFGLTAALFFLLVTLMSGPEVGALAALLFMVTPRTAYEIAGGFSKAWAIGFVLLAVYIVETRSWRIFPFVMPIAALAYPMSPVLMGAIVFFGVALEYPSAPREALRGLKYLVGGSALGILPLLYKYLSPSPRIGKMIPTEVMKEKWETGVTHEVPLPLWEEVLSYVQHPFFLYSLILVMILASRRGLMWKRSWTALALGSAICYTTAVLVIPRLYLPDRYTRYSMAVVLVLWFAHNWHRALGSLRYRWVRRAAMVGVVFGAALSFDDTFRPCDGKQALGRWEEKDRFAGVAAVIASEPQPVMLAGHPYNLAHLLVQSRRPVLVIHRMFHHWYDQFRETIDERAIDIFRALYARDIESVNQLASGHGVTHVVIYKYDYDPRVLATGEVWRPEFASAIREFSGRSGRFVLYPPPRHAILYEDDDFWLIRLPLKLKP